MGISRWSAQFTTLTLRRAVPLDIAARRSGTRALSRSTRRTQILVDRAQIDAVLETLEWNYVVANDTNAVAVLLTDLRDSGSRETSDEEDALLKYCSQTVESLNMNRPGFRGGCLV